MVNGMQDGASAFDLILGGDPEGQQVIADYKIAGQQLFFPDARPQTF